ncbi:hypothetical protein JB92DRAFT_2836162 [Gautieria morchelliformis]|nr:hypothetical protein JB92DRAFT_2836162 [Gautieria morchelliformis]
MQGVDVGYMVVASSLVPWHGVANRLIKERWSVCAGVSDRRSSSLPTSSITRSPSPFLHRAAAAHTEKPANRGSHACEHREGEEEGIPLMQRRGRGQEEKSDSGSSSCRMGVPPSRCIRSGRRASGCSAVSGEGTTACVHAIGVVTRRSGPHEACAIVGHAAGVASRWNSAVGTRINIVVTVDYGLVKVDSQWQGRVEGQRCRTDEWSRYYAFSVGIED